ncbi:MAG: hypothetical protein ACYCS7_16115 [Acidimicrobiales bacterium]
MTLGLAQRQGHLLDDVVCNCDQVLRPNSVYSLLHRERDRLFPDELAAVGRRTFEPELDLMLPLP